MSTQVSGSTTAAPLLHDITLDIRPGETMALVGITGSGKSALLQLVPRLYDVTEGAVTIDGVDVRDYDVEELRRIVAVAFEDTTLFSSSVRDNVLLGAPDPSDAALDEALDVAQAQFAYSLPDGVDTLIGEEGLSLSGGQRQRIALARAIAAKPKVLVLDDPLSALDVNTEERVEARLREVLRETTTLIVAHRPFHCGVGRPGGVARKRDHHRRRDPYGTAGRERSLPLRHRQPGRGTQGPGHRTGRARRSRGGPPVSAATFGTANEDNTLLTKADSKAVRRRSLTLLASLIRPVRLRFWLTIAMVVVSQLTRVAGPALIAFGIDNALPALQAGDNGPLVLAGALYLAAAIATAGMTALYVTSTARLSQAMLLDLRLRVFRHTQRLSLEFHEKYTSGPHHRPADLGP